MLNVDLFGYCCRPHTRSPDSPPLMPALTLPPIAYRCDLQTDCDFVLLWNAVLVTPLPSVRWNL